MKRMMRALAISLSLFCVCLSATACWFWGGYNKIMYDHFLDENNYYEWTVTVNDYSWAYVDEDRNYFRYSMYESSNNLEYKPFEEKSRMFTSIWVSVLSAQDDKLNILENGMFRSYDISDCAFSVDYRNTMALIESGFFENVQIGDTITIRATCWVYGDTDWLIVGSVAKDDVTYLDIQTGLQNNKKTMDKNRSLL